MKMLHPYAELFTKMVKDKLDQDDFHRVCIDMLDQIVKRAKSNSYYAEKLLRWCMSPETVLFRDDIAAPFENHECVTSKAQHFQPSPQYAYNNIWMGIDSVAHILRFNSRLLITDARCITPDVSDTPSSIMIFFDDDLKRKIENARNLIQEQGLKSVSIPFENMIFSRYELDFPYENLPDSMQLKSSMALGAMHAFFKEVCVDMYGVHFTCFDAISSSENLKIKSNRLYLRDIFFRPDRDTLVLDTFKQDENIILI